MEEKRKRWGRERWREEGKGEGGEGRGKEGRKELNRELNRGYDKRNEAEARAVDLTLP